MKFHENGPSIPNELIHASIAGEVVFFCGSGVSKHVGVDDFKGLTEKLINMLDPAPEARIRRWTDLYHNNDLFPSDMPVPYTDIYQELQDVYGTDEVERQISKIIGDARPKEVHPDPHELLINLSRNASREYPQLITTNVDRLFVKPNISAFMFHEAPTLPRVHHRQPYRGITYLHGLVPEAEDAPSSNRFVFSSADFGRAYLSEGWAARFMGEILKSGKSIVFVGYSAADPTIRFLLQALHADGEHYSLYAFAQGAPDKVAEAWSNKGTTAISYNEHADLWSSLEKWWWLKSHSEQWHAQMAKLASCKPSELRPFEREQVLFWLESPEGRRHFNEASSSPPAEWICVFDPKLRRQTPNLMTSDGWFDDGLRKFGLPDESCLDRETEEAGRECETRFGALTDWFIKHCEEPIAIWWTAGKKELPKNLRDRLFYKTNNHPQSFKNDEALKYWRLVLKDRPQKQNELGGTWIRSCREIPQTGLDFLVIDQMQKCLIPHVAVARDSNPFVKTFYPESWGALKAMVKFDVDLPIDKYGFGHLFVDQMDPEALHTIFRLLRCSLEQAVILFNQLPDSSIGRHLPDWPEEPKKQHNNIWKAMWVNTCQAFDSLCQAAPGQARAELLTLAHNEPLFFDKLRLYAYSRKDLFSGQDTYVGLCGLFVSSIECGNLRNQWAFSLKQRWDDFSEEQRGGFEEKLCGLFPGTKPSSPEEQYEAWNRALPIWRKVDELGIAISEAAQKHMRQEPPEEVQRIAKQAHESFITLMTQELGVKECSYLGGCELHKFEQLVGQDPEKAFGFLQQHDPKGDAIEFWGTFALLDRKDHSAEECRGIVTAFLALPEQNRKLLIRTVPHWFRRHLPELAKSSREEVHDWCVNYFNMLATYIPSSNLPAHEPSGIMDIGKQLEYPSTRLEEPFSLIAQTLMQIGIPTDFGFFESVLRHGGIVANGTMQVLAGKLPELFAENAKWTIIHLIPRFSGDTMDAAWSGLLPRIRWVVLSKTLLSHLRTPFIAAVKHRKTQRLKDDLDDLFAQFYVMMFDLISWSDTRQFLRHLGDGGRCAVIRALSQEEMLWESKLKSLLEQAWPKEKQYKTEDLTVALTDDLLTIPCQHFPEAVDVMLPILTSTQKYCLGLLDLYGDNGDERIIRHPETFLKLLHRLVPDTYKPGEAWGELRLILGQVTQAKPELETNQTYHRLYNLAHRAF